MFIFLTSYLYLPLNWKSPKLAYQLKGKETLLENGEKAGNISPFPTLFSSVSKRNCVIEASMKLSSANAFTLVESKISSYCKGLKNEYGLR